MSFLDPGNPEQAVINQAHISCVVTGTDLQRWVAYKFIDSYYDPAAIDSVEYVELQRGDDTDSLCHDPFTRGTTDANEPVWDPLEFFFLLLNIRLDQIKHEWQNIVAKLQESSEKFNLPLVGPSEL